MLFIYLRFPYHFKAARLIGLCFVKFGCCCDVWTAELWLSGPLCCFFQLGSRAIILLVMAYGRSHLRVISFVLGYSKTFHNKLYLCAEPSSK